MAARQKRFDELLGGRLSFQPLRFVAHVQHDALLEDGLSDDHVGGLQLHEELPKLEVYGRAKHEVRTALRAAVDAERLGAYQLFHLSHKLEGPAPDQLPGRSDRAP